MNSLNPALYEAQKENEKVRARLLARKEAVDGYYKKLNRTKPTASELACEEILTALAGELVEGAGTEELIRFLRGKGYRHGRDAYGIALRKLQVDGKIRRLGRKGLWLKN